MLASTLLAARAATLEPARRAAAWALLLLPSALLAVLGWAHRWTADDAFINFRVVDQFLAGNGPVFNAGERVEAYTSTLWLAMLAVVHGVSELRSVGVDRGRARLGALVWPASPPRPSARGCCTTSGPALVIPAGALVFAALPPSWDYATSGLETGLLFGWLGGVFLGLVAAERNPGWAHRRRWRPSRLDLLAVAIGLGPLVRPDFALFSAAFFVALLAVQRPTSVRSALRPLLVMVALPAAYQVFRMGYFAVLVPNTALAKEAGLSRWGQGAAYAWDTLGTYWLFVPLVLLGAWLARRLPDLARRSRTDLLLALLPVLAGALHIAYVIKVGGDFMHGRLMLPGLFALLMPVAALPLSPHRATTTAHRRGSGHLGRGRRYRVPHILRRRLHGLGPGVLRRADALRDQKRRQAPRHTRGLRAATGRQDSALKRSDGPRAERPSSWIRERPSASSRPGRGCRSPPSSSQSALG